MRIEFKSIKWRNFFSYPNVDTELSLLSHKATLIRGKNGVGKSTILDAICFVLFNRAFRDINRGDVVNDMTNKNCEVSIDFDIGSKEYRVIRGIRPDVFEVWENKQKINRDTDSREFQKTLENKILHCNFKTFCQVVILGSGSYTPFLELKTPDRRKIIDGLLDLDIFPSMLSILKVKITDLTTLMKDKEHDKDTLQQRISLLDMAREELQKNNESIINDFQLNKITLEQSIKSSRSRILVLEEIISEMVIEPTSDVEKKIGLLRDITIQCKTKIDAIDKEIAFITNHENCPTCMQKIDPNFRTEMVSKKTAKRANLVAVHEPAQEKMGNLRARKKDLESIIEEERQHRAEIAREKYRIEEWEQQISRIGLDISKRIQDNKKFDASEIDRLKMEVDKLDAEYQTMLGDINHHKAAITILPIIKGKVISKFVPIFNEQIQVYLNWFEFPIKFEINEDFEETMQIRGQKDKGYASLSEGQKYRVNMSLLFAWRAVARLRNSINCNLLFLDEIMDSSLDDDGKAQFMEILTNLHENTNVFVISHNADEVGGFDRDIEVTLRGNFSQMRVS